MAIMETGQTTKETEAVPPFVLEEQSGPILRLTLNRPNTLNSLSIDMLTALQTSLNQGFDNKSIRAIIINGAGKGFCAGHDLKEITAHRADEDEGLAYYKDLFKTCTDMMLTIAKLPVPVIAQIHGVAAAAGCQLVASCDMAIAEENTVFAVNGVDSGLFCSTPQVALSRNIPRKAAMEMLVLGERITSERALALGLINRSVPSAELEKTATDFAERASQKSRNVVALGKQAFYRQIELNIKDAYEDMRGVIVDNLLMPDAQCGIEAFIAKKTPEWNQD